jgi:GAF domain-containing protein
VEAVIRESRPEVVRDLDLVLGGQHRVVSALCTPLRAPNGAGDALLVVGRAQGRPRFSAEDLALLAEFTDQVAAALEIDRTRTQSEAWRLSDDRSRIALELNAHVVTGLFTLSLELLSLVRSHAASDTPDRLLDAVATIDDTIGWVRQTILGPGCIERWPDPLAHRVIAAVEDSGPTPGHEIRLDLNYLEPELPSLVTDEGVTSFVRC